MEDVHRAVLEKHEEELVESIILTEHLLGRMLQERIFDKEMVELIKVRSPVMPIVCDVWIHHSFLPV